MHTPNPEIQMPQPGRRRGRYSDDFKHQVVTTCLEPGVSTAAVALANGLNANLLRRWVVEATHRSGGLRSKATTLAPVHNRTVAAINKTDTKMVCKGYCFQSGSDPVPNHLHVGSVGFICRGHHCTPAEKLLIPDV